MISPQSNELSRSELGVGALTSFSNVEIETAGPEIQEDTADSQTLKRVLLLALKPLNSKTTASFATLLSENNLTERPLTPDRGHVLDWDKDALRLPTIIAAATTDEASLKAQPDAVPRLTQLKQELAIYEAKAAAAGPFPVEVLAEKERDRYRNFINLLAKQLRDQLRRGGNQLPGELAQLEGTAADDQDWASFCAFLRNRLFIPFLTAVSSLNPDDPDFPMTDFMKRLGLPGLIHDWVEHENHGEKGKHRDINLDTNRSRGELRREDFSDDGELSLDLLISTPSEYSSAAIESWLVVNVATPNQGKIKGAIGYSRVFRHQYADVIYKMQKSLRQAQSHSQLQQIRLEKARKLDHAICAIDLLIDSARTPVPLDKAAERLNITPAEIASTQEIARLQDETAALTQLLQDDSIQDAETIWALRDYYKDELAAPLMAPGKHPPSLPLIAQHVEQLSQADNGEQEQMVQAILPLLAIERQRLVTIDAQVEEDLEDLRNGQNHHDRSPKSVLQQAADYESSLAVSVMGTTEVYAQIDSAITRALGHVALSSDGVPALKNALSTAVSSAQHDGTLQTAIAKVVEDNPQASPDTLIDQVAATYVEELRHELQTKLVAAIKSSNSFARARDIKDQETMAKRITDAVIGQLTGQGEARHAFDTLNHKDLEQTINLARHKFLAHQQLQAALARLDTLAADLKTGINAHFNVPPRKGKNQPESATKTEAAPEEMDALRDRVTFLEETVKQQQAQHEAEIAAMRAEFAQQMEALRAQLGLPPSPSNQSRPSRLS